MEDLLTGRLRRKDSQHQLDLLLGIHVKPGSRNTKDRPRCKLSPKSEGVEQSDDSSTLTQIGCPMHRRSAMCTVACPGRRFRLTSVSYSTAADIEPRVHLTDCLRS